MIEEDPLIESNVVNVEKVPFPFPRKICIRSFSESAITTSK
jgi:hypothetical protein